MYAAVVDAGKIAQVLGLRRKVSSVEQLEQQVEAGLPKASLGAVARHVYGASPDAAALMQRVIPSATYHRRGEDLRPQESERVERPLRTQAGQSPPLNTCGTAPTTRGRSCPPATPCWVASGQSRWP